MNEINQIIEKGEKILWEGKPVFWPYYFVSFVSGIICLLFSLLIYPFFLGLYFLIIPYLYYNVTYYAITNRRVIFQTGIIGRDFKILEMTDISNAQVNVDVVDKLLGKNTGSISVFVPGDMMYIQSKRGSHAIPRPNMLSHVENPYEVFKYFKKVSFDVKTDIQYPNEYRPSKNPGYPTSYDGGVSKAKSSRRKK